jgi:hypothetical protein
MMTLMHRWGRELGAPPLPEGERGLEAHREIVTPHPTPLPPELGFTRVRHFKLAEVGYIQLRLGEGSDRVRGPAGGHVRKEAAP